MGLFKRRTKNTKGFTLIELIVVIAILAILAVIAIPRFMGMRETANEGAVIANLRTIQTAAETVAARLNVEITDALVTPAEIASALGVTALSDYDDSPEGAVYGWDSTNGVSVLTTPPAIYPTGGVDSFDDI
ncbi:MAG: prepilin-type N-terminal cleavage/methylation protein [Clostridia bacterium]|nr:prepilin-type N-terminal cleavage/methylation protein [Clostridia bacterium]